MTDLTKASEQAGKPDRELVNLIRLQRPAVEAQLAGTLNSGAFIRAALTTIRESADLPRCTPSSVLGSIMLAAQLRLEIGSALGHFYLTPRKVQGEWRCVPIIGYRGFITLAYRSGVVDKIETELVREGDTFERGSDSDRGRWYTFTPTGDEDRPWTGVLANAKIRDAGVVWSYLSKGQVMHRKPSTSNAGPWSTHEEAMARKTAVRDLASYLPMSTDLAKALEADEQQVDQIEGMDELVVTRNGDTGERAEAD